MDGLQNKGGGPGYLVVPDSLDDMKRALDNAAATWNDLKTTIDNLTMASLDLGLLGEQANYPAGYNDVKDQVVTRLDGGYDVLDSTAAALSGVVETYRNEDAEHYEDFGYIESDLD